MRPRLIQCCSALSQTRLARATAANAARGTRGCQVRGRIELFRAWVTRSAFVRKLVESLSSFDALELDEQLEGLLLFWPSSTQRKAETSKIMKVSCGWYQGKSMIRREGYETLKHIASALYIKAQETCRMHLILCRWLLTHTSGLIVCPHSTKVSELDLQTKIGVLPLSVPFRYRTQISSTCTTAPQPKFGTSVRCALEDGLVG